jgi:hypothetical protein
VTVITATVTLRLDIFTVMNVEVLVFWIVMLCSDMIGYQRFGGTHCLHIQGEDRMIYLHRLIITLA